FMPTIIYLLVLRQILHVYLMVNAQGITVFLCCAFSSVSLEITKLAYALIPIVVNLPRTNGTSEMGLEGHNFYPFIEMEVAFAFYKLGTYMYAVNYNINKRT
ncbi:hypothetical protein ACJX0J_029429, partial [Zea mays]